MGWLANFLKPPPEEDQSSNTGFHDVDTQVVPLKTAVADLRMARELINSAAMQTAQAYGVPANWLAFEVVTIADDEKAFFQLQIVMHHWDDYLAAHGFAFERAVAKRIRDSHIDVGRAVRAVLWRVHAQAGCPYDDMPDAHAWSDDAIRKRGQARERANRELYPAISPALVDAQPSLSAPTTQPAGLGYAAGGKLSAVTSMHDAHLEDGAYGESRPSTFNGYESTIGQPDEAAPSAPSAQHV